MTRCPGAPTCCSRCQLELAGIWNELSGIEAGGSDPGAQCLEAGGSDPGELLELLELVPACLHPGLTNKRPSLVELVAGCRGLVPRAKRELGSV